jgi:signal peptidase II
VVILDQFTKYLAIKFLQLNTPVSLINHFLNLTLVRNRGAAFGLLQNQLLLFVLVSCFTVGLIIYNLRSKNNSLILKISLSLILGGAIGNLIDRIRFGFVVDFLDLRVWPVFNFADAMITIAAVALTWEILFNKNAS